MEEDAEIERIAKYLDDYEKCTDLDDPDDTSNTSNVNLFSFNLI